MVIRSFDAMSDNPIRRYLGETLDLSVAFTDPPGEAEVVCYTNLNRKDGSWRPLRFRRKGAVYHFFARTEACGVFGFRIQYSFDKGATWIWDRSPLVYLHVDPERTRDIRCYTLLPTVSGRIPQWIEMLDPIGRMGFNMIHLLPVTRMDFSESPYSAKDLFSVDPSYHDEGPESDGLAAFERFVRAARKRGIALCVDLVLNHLGPGSDVGRKAPDCIMSDPSEPDGLQRSGCWHMNEWLKWGDLVKIHYAHPNKEKQRAIWDYMTEYALFWANYADYTGGMVRLDNLHNSDEDFIAHLLTELREAYPNLVIHAEYFSDANTVLRRARRWDLNLFLANAWEHPYAEDIRKYVTYCHEIGGRVRYHMPVTTHDTGAPAELFGSARAVVPRYFITALCGTGQTGWVQGAEHAVPKKVRFIGKNQPPLSNPDRWIVDRVSRINRLLAETPYLHRAGNLRFIDDDHGAVVGAFRPSGEDAPLGLVLLANLDTKDSHRISVDLKALSGKRAHTLENALDGTREVRTGSNHKFEIPPFGVAAFRLL